MRGRIGDPNGNFLDANFFHNVAALSRLLCDVRLMGNDSTNDLHKRHGGGPKTPRGKAMVCGRDPPLW